VTVILGLSPLWPTVSYKNIWRQETPSLSKRYFGPVLSWSHWFCHKAVSSFPCNYACFSRKHLPTQHPWISIRLSSIAFSKIAPFVATTVSALELTQLCNVFISLFYIFPIIARSFCFIYYFWRVMKIKKQSKIRHFHCRKFAHCTNCHLMCLFVSIELQVQFFTLL
jgi:hypothetical protein